jgi:hypothetical protein
MDFKYRKLPQFIFIAQVPGKLFLGIVSEAGGKHCQGLAKAPANGAKGYKSNVMTHPIL